MFKKAKRDHPIMPVCPARVEDQGACPSVAQGRQDDTVPLCAQTQHPQHANILWPNISVMLPTHKPGLAEGYWHKYTLPARSYMVATSHEGYWHKYTLLASKQSCSALQPFGTCVGSFTLSAGQ